MRRIIIHVFLPLLAAVFTVSATGQDVDNEDNADVHEDEISAAEAYFQTLARLRLDPEITMNAVRHFTSAHDFQFKSKEKNRSRGRQFSELAFGQSTQKPSMHIFGYLFDQHWQKKITKIFFSIFAV